MVLIKESTSTATKIISVCSNSSSLVNVQFLRMISLSLHFWVSRWIPSGLQIPNGKQHNGKHRAFEKSTALPILRL